jgi:cell division protein FtsN
MFLEGVLTDDGEKAISIYKDLVKKYPQSKYADASLYRICTYYFAVGKYSDVKSNFKKLKKYYPQSPYIKLTERDIPDEDVTDEKEVNENDKTASDIAVKPADSKSYKYTIQAGAFTIADNAKSLKSDLENAGYFTTIEDKTVGGASFHIIYVGKFVNQEDAKSFLQKLDKKYNLNGRVVSINSK